MPLIYHIVARSVWEALSAEAPYRAEALATEGLIHCAHAPQVVWVANQFYRHETDLLLLHIQTERLSAPVRDEDVGGGQRFPHVYGPIERSAVVAVQSLKRNAAGDWVWEGPSGTG